MGTRVSSKLLRGKMAFLLPGVPYCLMPGFRSLLDCPEGGDVMPPMPRCNAYGLQGTEFLDPLPVPRQSISRGRSLRAVGPPFATFPGKNPGLLVMKTRKRRPRKSRPVSHPPHPSEVRVECP